MDVVASPSHNFRMLNVWRAQAGEPGADKLECPVRPNGNAGKGWDGAELHLPGSGAFGGCAAIEILKKTSLILPRPEGRLQD